MSLTNGIPSSLASVSALRSYAYIAGPLFNEGERHEIEVIDTFLPHRDNPPKTKHNVPAIFTNDKAAIDRYDAIIAHVFLLIPKWST